MSHPVNYLLALSAGCGRMEGMNTWISVEDRLPEDGKYVIVHLIGKPWGDSKDPVGVFHDVAQTVIGISQETRERMKSGEILDPEEWTGDGYIQRSRIHRFGDEGFNNQRAFGFKPFGPGSHWGHEVDYWMEIPELPEPPIVQQSTPAAPPA
jgi:hypothetical protein